MKAVVPNRTLANSFEEIVHPIEQIIRIAKQETRKSTKLRDLLLPISRSDRPQWNEEEYFHNFLTCQ